MSRGTLITWTLEGSFLVHGEVSGYEAEPLPGAIVTVKNLRTGEDASGPAEEDGQYAVDLGDTGPDAFPSGYEVGDELEVSVTHRGVIRKWKRRVSGGGIEQDLHFTHGTWRGAMRRAKMISTEIYTGKAGLTFQLRDALVRDVLTVSLNGEPLPAGAWTWTKPNFITLRSAISAADVVEVEATLYRTIAQAKAELVSEGEGPVRDATARSYPTPLPERAPELQEISEALAAASLLDRIFSGKEKPHEEARLLRKYARERLIEIRDGGSALTDHDGAFIRPINQAELLPAKNPTTTRRQNPFTASNPKVDI